MAYDNKRHAIVHTSKLFGCACFSFISNTPVDNGMLIAKGELEENEREIYKAELDITKPAYLVADTAWQYDDSTYAKKYDEGLYYIEACKPFRTYELKPTRRFEVSSEAFDGEIAKGDYVVATAEGKLKKAASETNDGNAFVGKVIDENAFGFTYHTGSAGVVDTGSKFYLIEIIKNEAVS